MGLALLGLSAVSAFFMKHRVFCHTSYLSSKRHCEFSKKVVFFHMAGLRNSKKVGRLFLKMPLIGFAYGWTQKVAKQFQPQRENRLYDFCI